MLKESAGSGSPVLGEIVCFPLLRSPGLMVVADCANYLEVFLRGRIYNGIWVSCSFPRFVFLIIGGHGAAGSSVDRHGV